MVDLIQFENGVLSGGLDDLQGSNREKKRKVHGFFLISVQKNHPLDWGSEPGKPEAALSPPLACPPLWGPGC